MFRLRGQLPLDISSHRRCSLNEATDITPFNVCVNTTKFFSIIKSIRSDIVNIDITQQGLLISDAFIKIHLPLLMGRSSLIHKGKHQHLLTDTTTCKGSDLNGLDKLLLLHGLW